MRTPGPASDEAALDDTLLPTRAEGVFVKVDQPLERGRRVGEYVIEAPLGAGAFGTVYRGVHPVIGKAVAVKVLSMRYSVDPSIVARFIDEARAVNRIGHAGIIDIFAFGQLEDGRQYYVMELLEGSTLLELLESRGRLKIDEALAILEPVGRALDAAHAAGIAHRDLKPANIFLAKDDGRWRPKLLDFGVAKLMGDFGDGKSRTETGATVGTPAYMSPEQCLGKGVDHRTDVYSLGVVAFQMLTGRLPFDADSAFSLMASHLNNPPPDVRGLAPDVSEPVSRALRWLLAKDPADRPQSLGEAVAALAAAARGVEVTGGMPEAARRRGSSRAPLLAVAVVAFAAVGAWLGLREPPADDEMATVSPPSVQAAEPVEVQPAPAPATVAPAVTTAPASLAAAPVSAAPPAPEPARRPRPSRAGPRGAAAGGDRGLHDIEPWQ